MVVLAPDEPPERSPPPAPPAEEFVPPPGMLPDAPPPIEAVPGDVVVLVGTTKGLFVLSAGPDRTDWERTGPWFPGEEGSSAVLDCRAGRTRLPPALMRWLATSVRKFTDVSASGKLNHTDWFFKSAPVRFHLSRRSILTTRSAVSPLSPKSQSLPPSGTPSAMRCAWSSARG